VDAIGSESGATLYRNEWMGRGQMDWREQVTSRNRSRNRYNRYGWFFYLTAKDSQTLFFLTAPIRGVLSK